jgi:uncharacterized membrane protein
MFDKQELLSERNLYLAFQASLILKALFALVETVGGLLAYFVNQESVLDFAQAITQAELAEDPRDIVANYLLHQAEHLSVSAQHFAALYLLSHGIIKLVLIGGLLRRKLSFYPTAIIVFILFVLYQLYLYGFTHSVSLLLITALDVVVVGLTWHEYRYLRRLAARSAA